MAEKRKVWFCKIGWAGEDVPEGGDMPMRDAVEAKFRELVGRECEFTFSGWGAALDEAELAVVENREPRFFETGWLEDQLHSLRAYMRYGEARAAPAEPAAPYGLPDWTPEVWLATILAKLGQVALLAHPEARDGLPWHEWLFEHPDGRQLSEMLMATAAGVLDMIESFSQITTADEERIAKEAVKAAVSETRERMR